MTKAKACSPVPGRVGIHFQGSSAGVTDLSASSECGSGPTSNWSEIGRRYRPRKMTKKLSLKARVEVCAVYTLPLILYDCMYFLCLRFVGWRCNDPSPNWSGVVEDRWSTDRSAFNVCVMGSRHA